MADHRHRNPPPSRRRFLASAALAAAGLGLPSFVRGQETPDFYEAQRDNINQSVVRWCFGNLSVDALAAAAAKMGIKSVELVGPNDWDTLRKHGLKCAIVPSHGFAKGFAHREEWDECLAKLRASIDNAADAGFPSVITFSGFRRGLSDAQATANMIAGLKQIAGHAEKLKVNLCIEVLNSRVDVSMKGHPDYWADTVERAAAVCDGVGSERVKILFDIYHTQIMQGDIITRIRRYKDYIGHFHTAGVPGRRELDEKQENNYPAIMRAIAETGYAGYVGHEFIPTSDQPLQSLSQAVRVCDV